MRQFEPCAGECFVKRLRIVEETTGNFLEFWIETQRQVSHQHGGFTFLRRIERIGNDFWRINRFELDRARRAARLHPLVFEQVFEEVITPLGRRLRPDHFQTRGNRIAACAAAVVTAPAQPLQFNRRGFWINANMGRRRRTVGFTQRVTAANQRHGFFVVHAHIAERRADSRSGGKRFTAVIRPFRVNVDKPHFGSA